MNLTKRLIEVAHRFPQKVALKAPNRNGKYRHLTFEGLEKKIQTLAAGLIRQGVKKDDRVLVFLKPSLDFAPSVFALFQIGAIPVFIDPGMGLKNLLNAIKEVRPRVLVAENIVHFASWIFRKSFKSIELGLCRNPSWILSAISLQELSLGQIRERGYSCSLPTSTAAILFTSGGTGKPKGVIYTQAIFNYQIDVLQDIFQLKDTDIDLPGFPLFGLFTLCMGMTSVIPQLNPAKPGSCDPKKLYRNIRDNQATFLAGSPAIWKNLATYLQNHHLTLPSVKYLVMFGAPVRPELHEAFVDTLPNAQTYTPYGATECLPVCQISRQELLPTFEITRQGGGTCIGKPTPKNKVAIIAVTAGPIEDINDCQFLGPNEVGEIIVKGPSVTPGYFELPDKTALAKIKEGNQLWHRMGDVGRIDDRGNLWFYGRLSHYLQSENGPYYSIPCEAIFNEDLEINRCALIGPKIQGKMTPSLVIEPRSTIKDKKSLLERMKKYAEQHPHTKGINQFFIYKNFPVDGRHNIKIDRLKLRELCEQGKLEQLS